MFCLFRARAALAYLAAGPLLGACVPSVSRPVAPPSAPLATQPPPAPAPVIPAVAAREAPAALLNALQGLGGRFAGTVGIAVRDIDEGWLVSFNAAAPMPQQSVSKLWVAIAVMDAVDRGALSLTDPVTVRRSDLTLFHQPIRARVGRDGYETSIGALLEGAMTRSDNTCNDVLLWKVGGPSAIRAMLARKRIAGVTFGPGEGKLQARIAGLTWRPEWAGGWGFLQARAKLSFEARDRALRRYLAAPYDGASAQGVTLGLAMLARGALLRPASSAHLIALMQASRTGPARMRAGLKPGWTLAHKTGTGQDLGTMTTGYNDVGILTGPDGHRYAVAVMIASTRVPIPVRQRLMANVVRAVIRTRS